MGVLRRIWLRDAYLAVCETRHWPWLARRQIYCLINPHGHISLNDLCSNCAECDFKLRQTFEVKRRYELTKR